MRAGSALLVFALLWAGGCQTSLSGKDKAPQPGAAAAPTAGQAGEEELPEGLEGVDPEELKPGPWEFKGFASVIALPGAEFRDADWKIHAVLKRIRFQANKKPGMGARLQLDGVYERRDYKFDGPVTVYPNTYDPLTVVNSFQFRLRYLQPFHPEWAAFLIGTTALEAEEGAPLTDGVSWAVALGIGHRFSFGMDLGLGLLYLERPGNQQLWLPVVQGEWEVDDYWTLSLDGTELRVEGKVSEQWTWALSATFDSLRMRLRDEAPANSGIFTDSQLAITLRAIWTPVEDLDLELGVGFNAYRELFFADKNGDNSQDYRLRPAPVIGFRMTVRF